MKLIPFGFTVLQAKKIKFILQIMKRGTRICGTIPSTIDSAFHYTVKVFGKAVLFDSIDK